MNIKKIVVDKVPESCIMCPFAATDFEDEPVCAAIPLEEFLPIDLNSSTRPSWCPLETEGVCEWVLNYHIDNAVWDIAPSCCVGEFSMNKPNYEICPNCGKRIKYVEVE